MATRIDRPQTRTATLALAAGLALMICSPADAQRQFPDEYFFDINQPEIDARHAAMTGQPMPELSVSDWMNVDGVLSGGDPLRAAIEGKILVVDLWATWCGPCLAAIPENNALAEEYADEEVLVLGICTSSGQEKLAKVVEDREIAYPVARDPDRKTEEAWNVAYYPTYAVVDRKGIVRAIGLMPGHIEDVVKAILEEQPADAEKADAEKAGN
jgi:thiol-disulfide isomerase/thioredoxin